MDQTICDLADLGRLAPSPRAKPLDIVVVGAGLSGIGAACHLQRRCADRTVMILEARDAIGRTWDFFRYPGVRSDSDMLTLGYGFRPWRERDAIADGVAIRRYIRETATEAGVDRLIRFGRRVTHASWSSETALWTLAIVPSRGGPPEHVTCRFLLMCSGYYSYAEAHHPEIPGAEQFRGRIVHPQFWPEDLDYRDKRVVIVGSGATAITMAPAMAGTARHVTMLQRSPTYLVSLPAVDSWWRRLGGWLPEVLVVRIARVKNIALASWFYRHCRRRPERARRYLLGQVRQALGPDFDLSTHFSPRYKPWDQRLCVVRDGDLFETLRSGKASIITDTIERFTPVGLRLRSGWDLEADLVVTATGLKLNLLGDVQFTIDGRPADLSREMIYKGAMLSNVPNLIMFLGYTNASWTLKTDLVADFGCRLLRAMRRRGRDIVMPVAETRGEGRPLIGLSSGYVQRARDLLPRQGADPPWTCSQNYWLDLVMYRFGALDDGVLRFSRRHAAQASSATGDAPLEVGPL